MENNMKKDYVHGYSQREALRLSDQARTMAEILHYDTRYPSQSSILEAGCGVGAQTVILAKKESKSTYHLNRYLTGIN